MLFVGNGRDKAEIQKSVEDSGLKDNVTLLGMVDDRESLKSIYAISKVFLFPSLYDNASLAIREAAAFKIPSLFIRGATTARGIVDGKNGFLAENTPGDYAAKLLYLMDNAALVEKVGNGAAASIYISWEKIIDDVYRKYAQVIDRYKIDKLRAIGL